ncbi:MAG: hypothetical protein NC933_04920 [Candidatus Omnitrophica bacterium]|nr:hypothetical protein [Candidatus Omnitrophota bacterium]
MVAAEEKSALEKHKAYSLDAFAVSGLLAMPALLYYGLITVISFVLGKMFLGIAHRTVMKNASDYPSLMIRIALINTAIAQLVLPLTCVAGGIYAIVTAQAPLLAACAFFLGGATAIAGYPFKKLTEINKFTRAADGFVSPELYSKALYLETMRLKHILKNTYPASFIKAVSEDIYPTESSVLMRRYIMDIAADDLDSSCVPYLEKMKDCEVSNADDRVILRSIIKAARQRAPSGRERLFSIDFIAITGLAGMATAFLSAGLVSVVALAGGVFFIGAISYILWRHFTRLKERFASLHDKVLRVGDVLPDDAAVGAIDSNKIQLIITDLVGKDYRKVEDARQALLKMGEKALPYLKEAQKDKKQMNRVRISDVIEEIEKGVDSAGEIADAQKPGQFGREGQRDDSSGFDKSKEQLRKDFGLDKATMMLGADMMDLLKGWVDIAPDSSRFISDKDVIVKEKMVGDIVLRVYASPKTKNWGVQCWLATDKNRYDVDALFNLRWFDYHQQWAWNSTFMKTSRHPQAELYFDESAGIIHIMLDPVDIEELNELGVSNHARILIESRAQSSKLDQSEGGTEQGKVEAPIHDSQKPDASLANPSLTSPTTSELATITSEAKKKLEKYTSISHIEAFEIVESSVPKEMKALRAALRKVKPLAESEIPADVIAKNIERAQKKYKLSEEQTRILRLALLWPGQGMGEAAAEKKTSAINADPEVARLFEIVEGTVNNERARMITNGNLLRVLVDKHKVIPSAPGEIALHTGMATSEIKERLQTLLGSLDSMPEDSVPADIKGLSNRLKAGLTRLEADSIVASVIAIARRAKYNDQKLIIGLETDWIPGYEEKGSLQRNAINSLVKEIESLGDTLRSLGLDNVIVVHRPANELADVIIKEAERTNTKLSNVVVLGSNTTLESDSFIPLRSTDNDERAFLACVDPSELKRFSDEHTASLEQLNIRIMEMLCLALELAAGKEPPKLPLIASYDKVKRLVVFLPKAEPVDYEKLKDIYKAQAKALQAA